MITGDFAALKAIVIPMRRDIREDEIIDLVGEMDRVRLIEWYDFELDEEDYESEEGDNRRQGVIQITDWWHYQRLKDPRRSRYPPPQGWDKDRGGQARDDLGRFGR